MQDVTSDSLGLTSASSPNGVNSWSSNMFLARAASHHEARREASIPSRRPTSFGLLLLSATLAVGCAGAPMASPSSFPTGSVTVLADPISDAVTEGGGVPKERLASVDIVRLRAAMTADHLVVEVTFAAEPAFAEFGKFGFELTDISVGMDVGSELNWILELESGPSKDPSCGKETYEGYGSCWIPTFHDQAGGAMRAGTNFPGLVTFAGTAVTFWIGRGALRDKGWARVGTQVNYERGGDEGGVLPALSNVDYAPDWDAPWVEVHAP